MFLHACAGASRTFSFSLLSGQERCFTIAFYPVSGSIVYGRTMSCTIVVGGFLVMKGRARSLRTLLTGITPPSSPGEGSVRMPVIQ